MCYGMVGQSYGDCSFEYHNICFGWESLWCLVSEEAEDPAAIPIYWVSKWVDYSDKYGLGYQLCDNSVGVLFNDSTRLILLSNGE